MGYYGVFLGLQYKNDRDMIQKLDAENYSNDETVTIKLPITVPYAFDSEGFQRVDGKFEYKGEFYRLVKQRLSQDTLYVICVKDAEHKRIGDAMTSFVKTFTDKTTDHNPGAKVVVSFIKDYIAQPLIMQHISLGWESDVVKESTSDFLQSSFCSSIIHPPERG